MQPQTRRGRIWCLVAGSLWWSGLALLHASQDAQAGFSLARRPSMFELWQDGQLLTRLYFGRHWDKPFLHPLRTLSGIEISRRWPVAESEEHYKDHPWHRGLWWGHGDINGVDFWRELGEGKTGKLLLVSAPQAYVGGGKAALSLELALQPPGGKALGTVLETFTIWQQPPHLIIDAQIVVRADQGVALHFGDTEDGGFAFRLTDLFRQDQGARLLNSEGLEGTEHIWGQPARWVDYSATIKGHRCGVAILDHPANLRHPTRWHARGYGLCAANPFALRSFTRNPKVDGAHTLPAGQSLTLRYRVVIHQGEVGPQELESLYRAFTEGKQ